MIHDKYKKRYRVAPGSSRLRQQIALEAARRLLQGLGPQGDEEAGQARERFLAIPASDLYVAKRKAAAVLGHRVREGDLPSDDEVREHLIALERSGGLDKEHAAPIPDSSEHDPIVPALSEHLDRFTLYKLRLEPLEAVKQNPKHHPEGDVLYHSLQVFALARDARPYDEEFLLAALLHDVGKAIEPRDHVAAAVEALRGAVTLRTLWLIEHHMDLLWARERPLEERLRRELDCSEHLEDLRLLRELDNAGRVPGYPVETVEEVLAYIRGLESEEYLTES